ncbi:MAG: hypothetical protein KGN02_14955 [bacterium]|nr:hypothetical protein [bacterium]
MDLIRNGLLQRIERATPRVVRIVAPAGYGKSVLLRQIRTRHGARVVDLRRADAPRDAAIEACRDLADDPGAALAIDHAELLDCATIAELAPLLDRDLGPPLLLASRQPIALERHVPPHRMLTLGSEDLRFTRDEIALVLHRGDHDAAHVGAIERLTRGWPMLVFFLERLAREGALDLASNAFRSHASMRELFAFLQRHLYDGLDGAQHDALVLAAAVRDFSICDLDLFEGAVEFAQAFADLEDRSLLVHRAGLWDVSPMVRMLVHDREPHESRRLVRKLARAHARAGNDARAVELFLDGDDVEDAIEIAERACAAGTTDTPEWSAAIARLPFQELCRHRSLWWIVQPALFHFAHDHPYRAAAARDIPLGEDSEAANAALLTRGIFAILDGDNERAVRILATVVHELGREPDQRFRAIAHAYHFVAAARVGQAEIAERAWASALAADAGIATTFALEHLLQRYRDALFADVDAAWPTLRDEYDRVEASAALRGRIRCAKGLATIARIGNAPEALEYALADLRALADDDPATVGPLVELFERGTVPEHALQPGQRALDLYVAALVTASRGDRPGAVELLERARRVADGNPDPLLARADALVAAQIGTPLDVRPVLHVVAGSLIGDGAPTTLPDRSIELLLLLRMRGGAATRETLQDALWNDLVPDSRRNALKSCIHRTRTLLGACAGALISTTTGYALAGLRIDILEAHERCTTLLASDANGVDPEALSSAATQIQDGLPAHFHAHDVFVSLHHELLRTAQAAWMRVGDIAIARGDSLLVRHAIEALRAIDEYDEGSYALAISAALARDDRDDAQREFRAYATLLERELRTAPSEELLALLRA